MRIFPQRYKLRFKRAGQQRFLVHSDTHIHTEPIALAEPINWAVMSYGRQRGKLADCSRLSRNVIGTALQR